MSSLTRMALFLAYGRVYELSAGPNVKATDDKRRTPLSWAGGRNQRSEMVDLLIEHGGKE